MGMYSHICERHHDCTSENKTRISCIERCHAMYATRLMTDIYHLVEPGGQHTLCGLRVSRVTSARKTNTLQLVSGLQPNLTICKHCERIQGQENNFAADLRG